MADVLALVSARRAQIEQEVRELDQFIGWAEMLLHELGSRPAVIAAEQPPLPPNVIRMDAAFRRGRRDARADGTGA